MDRVQATVGRERVDTLAAALGDQKIERIPALPDLVDGRAHLVDQRSFDLGAGGDTASADDAWQRVPAFTREEETSVVIAIERGARRDHFVDPRQPRVDE